MVRQVRDSSSHDGFLLVLVVHLSEVDEPYVSLVSAVRAAVLAFRVEEFVKLHLGVLLADLLAVRLFVPSGILDVGPLGVWPRVSTFKPLVGLFSFGPYDS